MKTSVTTRYSAHVIEEDGQMIIDGIRFPVGSISLAVFRMLESPTLWEAVTALKRLPEQERSELMKVE